MDSLFLIIFKKFQKYEDLFHDIAKLSAMVLIYFIFSSQHVKTYIFDVPNTLLLITGLFAYHLVFTKILRVEFGEKTNM